MKIFKIFLILTVISLFIFACAEKPNNTSVANTNTVSSPQNTTTNAAPAPTFDEIASGGKLYNEYCAKCHKEDGSGGEVVIEGRKMKPDNLISAKMKKEPDAEYIEYIRDGIPDEGMPAFKDTMSEAQIKQVVKYIREELQK